LSYWGTHKAEFDLDSLKDYRAVQRVLAPCQPPRGSLPRAGQALVAQDYHFEWDVDLTGKPNGRNTTIALRCNCEHLFGAMFGRPFLYRKIAP
jgi:hypothetical protein